MVAVPAPTQSRPEARHGGAHVPRARQALAGR